MDSLIKVEKMKLQDSPSNIAFRHSLSKTASVVNSVEERKGVKAVQKMRKK